MARSRFVANPNYPETLTAPGGPLYARMEGFLLEVQSRARRELANNNRSGTLANSITIDIDVRGGRLHGQVGTRVRYAAAQELGARPHVIRAKNAKYLVFRDARKQGKYVKRRRVSHPGNVPLHFLRLPMLQAARAWDFVVVHVEDSTDGAPSRPSSSGWQRFV
jgi:hypothetical protein